MKSSFIAGFVKQAVELGFDDETIARVFKRAMANQAMSGMFNQLPEGGPIQPPQGQMAPPMQPQVQPQMGQLGQQPMGQPDPQHLAIIQQLLANQPPMPQQ